MLWAVGWVAASAQDFHAITLVDEDGAPYPCATLDTVHHVRWVTDVTGTAAVYEPGLEGEDVWLTLAGPFEAPVDWLDISGVEVRLRPGGTTRIVLPRTGPDRACALGDRNQRLLAHGVPQPGEMHEIDVVDAETGNPVPTVRLRALGEEYWTDNGGRVAFFDLDAMDDTVRFDVFAHGYAHDPGYVEVVPAPGGTTTIAVDRVNLAQRRTRLTGGGLWRDSVLLGYAPPLASPVLDSDVLGQDTAHAVAWRGGLFWLWGDTSRPSYPLGNFRTTGATAPIDPTPEDGVDLTYFEAADGFVAPIAPVFPEGPTWMSGLVALDDDELWGTFVVVDATFAVFHSGMVRWSDASDTFVPAVLWTEEDPVRPSSPAIRYTGPDGDWVMYREMVRVPAEPAALSDPATYEAYTPLAADGAGGYTLAFTPDGALDWQWRTGVPPVTKDAVTEGLLRENQSPWHAAVEPDTGETPILHNGTIAWNAWRQRWIHVYTESFGSTSLIGEIWYAEGDTPVGPWSWTRKIVTHDNYSFYNPYFHPWFADRGGKTVAFEGTYTAWLGTDDITPRHDYNQQLYTLDLDASAVSLPVPMYRVDGEPHGRRAVTEDATEWFGAHELPAEGRIPVYWTAPSCDPARSLTTSAEEVDGDGEVAFYALPAGAEGPGTGTLFAWTEADGPAWGLASEAPPDATALATVWLPTWEPSVPLSLYPVPERADAGPDVCGASAPVHVDGGASTLAEPITSYTWTWSGGTASGAAADLALPPGVHAVTLTVAGETTEAWDTVFIEVIDDTSPLPTEPTPPVDDPPAEDDDPASTAPPGGGCGCAASSSGGDVAAVLLAAVGAAAAARRRRSRRSGDGDR